MNAIVIPTPLDITNNEAVLKTAIEGIGLLVELRPETLKLVASGITVQKEIDKIADDIEIADSITIDSPDMLAEAQTLAGKLANVCADSGVIEVERKAMVAPFNDLVKKINEGYKLPRAYVETILKGINGRGGLAGKILAYNAEQQRIAAAAAEAERKRREDDLAAARIKEAADMAAAQELMAKAQAAQAEGSVISAGALMTQASVQMDAARQEATAAVTASHTRVYVAPAATAKGVRSKWTAEVTNKEAFVLHVAAQIGKGDKSLLAYLNLDLAALNNKANIEREAFSLPGVQAGPVASLSIKKVAA